MTAMEWAGFITGVICVYWVVKEKDINWPVGVLNSLILAYVFWKVDLYAQAWLQIIYFLECFYGWYRWTRRDPVTGMKLLRIGRTNRQTMMYLGALSVPATAVVYWIFVRTNDPAPFLDSVITVASLIAEYMLCLKLTEGWLVYFGADLLSLIILGWLGQWVTLGTYLCFTGLCVLGIREWAKKLPASGIGPQAGNL